MVSLRTPGAHDRRLPAHGQRAVHRYWKYAQEHYRKPDGTPTETADNLKPALRTLRKLYGDVAAGELGPIALKTVRQRFIEDGQSRRTVDAFSVNASRWHPIRLSSVISARCFEDGELDFVFIDGEHSYETVKADIEVHSSPNAD